MKKLILIRGPPAVGKTTLSKELCLRLKKDYHQNCAFIAEDDFRKQMQFKYKAADKIVHLNSVEIIKTVINKLNSLDQYEYFIVEGLLRYPLMVENYKKYCKTKNMKLYLFQLEAPLAVRQKRDLLSRSRDHIVGLRNKESTPETKALKGSIIIDTKQPVEYSVDEIISTLDI